MTVPRRDFLSRYFDRDEFVGVLTNDQKKGKILYLQLALGGPATEAASWALPV